MKQFRITTTTQLNLTLFESSKEAYLKSDRKRTIRLRPEDFADVEWLGCEFVRDDNNTCLNLVNVAFAKATENNSGYLVKPITGWIVNDLLPFCDVDIDSMSIRKIADGIRIPHPIEIDRKSFLITV